MRNTTMLWVALLALVACGEEETPIEPDPPYPAKVTVDPETAKAARFGREVTLTATVTDQYGDAMDTVAVSWSSTDTMVATVDDGGVFVWMTGTADIVATVAGPLADTATISAELVQRDALVAIYDSLDGPNWKESDNWGTRTELNTWFGVTTDRAGNPTKLILLYNDLSGRIPINELLKLEHLHLLDVGFNFNISGTIPPELGDMKSLRRISLHHNALTGTIPEELSKLDLDTLDLHMNELTGEIPDWLGQKTNLGRLDLWGNNFTGELPESLGNLRRLWIFSVFMNPLSGPLPRSFMNMSNLWYFYWGDDTELCSPADEEFQDWLDQVPTQYRGPVCDED